MLGFEHPSHMVTHPSTDEAQCCLTLGQNVPFGKSYFNQHEFKINKSTSRPINGSRRLKKYIQQLYYTTPLKAIELEKGLGQGHRTDTSRRSKFCRGSSTSSREQRSSNPVERRWEICSGGKCWSLFTYYYVTIQRHFVFCMMMMM